MTDQLCYIEVRRRKINGYDQPDWRRWQGVSLTDPVSVQHLLALLQALWPQHRFRIAVTEATDAERAAPENLP